MGYIWSAETGFGSHPDHKRSRPPTSTVLDVLSTVSARAGYRSVRVSWYARFTKVRSNDLSTQHRRARTSSTVSPPVSTTVADPKRSADSEQIRVATIALHTEQEIEATIQPHLCNRKYFGVQKAKNRDRGTIVYSAALTGILRGLPPEKH